MTSWVRCGCGALYQPSVRTQRVCDACGAARRVAERARLVSSALRDPDASHAARISAYLRKRYQLG